MAIDVGGTKTLMALFGDDGQIQKRVKFPTPPDYSDFLGQLKVEWQSFGQPTLLAGAAGLPGSIDRELGRVISCGNLDWKDQSSKTDLELIFGCPFALENDAKSGGLSEAILVKNEFKHVLYVTLGTGIGYAYIVDGVIDLNYSDSGGAGLMLDVAGRPASWESLASGTAIVRDYGQTASEITDPAIWQKIAQQLGLGIIELLKTAKPEVIIFGGGVGVNFDKFKNQLADYLKTTIPEPPLLSQAVHAEDAVLNGCYLLASQLATSSEA